VSETIRDTSENAREGAPGAQESASRAVEDFRQYQLKLVSAVQDDVKAEVEDLGFPNRRQRPRREIWGDAKKARADSW
jgi:hypothetical protein